MELPVSIETVIKNVWDGFWRTLLVRHKTIRITVHLDVDVSRLETQIIDTKAFQRLHRIRQLGFVYLVYPSAKHSRFEHSIGALKVADAIVKWCNENKDVAERILNLSQPPPYRAFEIGPREHVLTRLAALMHDLAHIPHGHELEKEGRLFTKTQWLDEDRVKHIFNEERLCDIIMRFLLDEMEMFVNDTIHQLIHGILRCYGAMPKRELEERIKERMKSEIPNQAGRFVKELVNILVAIEGGKVEKLSLKRVNNTWRIDELKITPLKPDEDTNGNVIKTAEDKAIEELANKGYHSFIGDIVGNTICADLIDYVYRDLYHCGISAKEAPLEALRFLRFFAVVGERDYTGARLVLLLVNERGRLREDNIRAVFQLLDDRYFLAERVYYHRVKLALSSLLISAFSAYCHDRARQKQQRREQQTDGIQEVAKELLTDLLKIGDDELLDYLRSRINDMKDPYDKETAENLLNALERRVVYRPILMINLVQLEKGLRKEVLKYEKPTPRYNLERFIEHVIKAPPGSVLIYISKRDRGKAALVKCLYAYIPSQRSSRTAQIVMLPLKTLLKEAPPFKDVHAIGRFDALRRDYDLLWRVYVFVSRDLYEESYKDPILGSRKKRELLEAVCKRLLDVNANHLLPSPQEPPGSVINLDPATFGHPVNAHARLHGKVIRLHELITLGCPDKWDLASTDYKEAVRELEMWTSRALETALETASGGGSR